MSFVQIVWSLHDLSDVAVLAVASYCVMSHTVSSVQIRSLVAVSTVDIQCVAGLHTVRALHSRS